MKNPFIRLGRIPYPGSSVVPGHAYHDLPFDDYWDAPVHRRGTEDRVHHMLQHYDVRGKGGLDLGCSVGGISFGFQMAGAHMVGIDADRASIRVAHEVEEVQKTGAVFLAASIPSGTFYDLLEERFDFIVFLSAFMWVAKAEGMEKASDLMRTLAKSSPVLWFETAENPSDGSAGDATPFHGKDDVRKYLKQFYPSVEDTGMPKTNWFPRTMFLCRT